VSSTERTAREAEAASKSSASLSRIPQVRAFWASGRLRVMRATPLSTRYRTVSSVAGASLTGARLPARDQRVQGHGAPRSQHQGVDVELDDLGGQIDGQPLHLHDHLDQGLDVDGTPAARPRQE